MKSCILFIVCCLSVNCQRLYAQYKSFDLTVDGDTVNAVNKDGLKCGMWVNRVEELRGEPGFEEEGKYVNGQKDGFWKIFSLQGDLIGVERYKMGGKDGVQRYFTNLGDLIREENWLGYDPQDPYDTIPIYGDGSNEVLSYKIVKAEPYSVKDGEWKFFEPGTGNLIRKETWDRNRLVSPQQDRRKKQEYVKPNGIEKTDEMKDWDKKNRGKKGAYRDGAVGF
jgi:hypothetical protein